MPGPSPRGVANRPQAGLRLVLAVVSAAVLAVGGTVSPSGGPAQPVARASVMAVDASDYVPTVANLPGYHEEAAAEGGDLDPTISMRRSFATSDGSGWVIVSVSVGSSIANAQAMLTDRINRLVHYQDWQISPSDRSATVASSAAARGRTAPAPR